MSSDAESLDPGITFYAWDGDNTHVVKLSALLRRVGAREVLGLVGRGMTSAPTGSRVTVRPGEVKQSIGRIETITEVFPDAGKLDALFQIVRFDEAVASGLEGTVSDAAISKNLERNVFSKGLLRVRKLTSPAVLRSSKSTRRVLPPYNTKGFLTGNVLHPIIERHEGRVTLDRAGIARGRGRQEFAMPGDSGAPVLSASGALLGFVVGRDANRALVLSAEDVMDRMSIHFVVAAERPGALRGARIRRRQSVVQPQASAAE